MCTAVTYRTDNHYFGRTLDYEFSYHETVTVTPRGYRFSYRHVQDSCEHYAIIGMAYVVDNYPLYYDGTNEYGLSMAGLNFPGNAYYGEPVEGKDNVSPFELIPWILGQCRDIGEVKQLLENINLINENYSEALPLSPLHWIIADRDEAIVLESMKDGLKVYDNPVGVLTNNPPFQYHMHNIANYMQLSSEEPANNMSSNIDIKPYSRGMGAMGLPGDLSSASRFVRAAFTRLNSVSGQDEMSSVSQFFHILGAVAQQRGLVHMGENQYEISIYTSCCNTDKGIYYYRTYDSHSIKAVDMHREQLDGDKLISYELRKDADIYYHN